MHYIVDGYNLLFRILTSSVDLSKRRQQIVENLNKKIKLLGIQVTIVFDSNYRLEESAKSHFDALEIQFTSRGITADEWIIEKVQKIANPETIIVVTSDKKLAWIVRSSSIKTESIEEFVTTLNKRVKNKLECLKYPQQEQQVQETPPTPVRTVSKLKPKPVEKKEKEVKPKDNRLNPNEALEFYLKEFEESYKKNAPPEKPVVTKREPKKHEFQKTKKEVSHHKPAKVESENERWERLFGEKP